MPTKVTMALWVACLLSLVLLLYECAWSGDARIPELKAGDAHVPAQPSR
jgi:hypothetical protein